MSRHIAWLLVVTACSSAGGSLSEAERSAIEASVDSATRAFQAAERARDAERTIATGPTTLVWQRRGADWLIIFADADHYPVTIP